MIITKKITVSIVSITILVFAFLLSTQFAYAQELFDGPTDGPAVDNEEINPSTKPLQFRSLQRPTIYPKHKDDSKMNEEESRDKPLRLKDVFKSNDTNIRRGVIDDTIRRFKDSPKKEEFRKEQKGARESFFEDVRATRKEFRNEVDIRREEIKSKLELAETPEEKKTILDSARAERDSMREDALKKREEFKARAKELRDKFKTQREELRTQVKTIEAEGIKKNLENILVRISNTLDKFTNLLDRINNKVAEIEANGIDTSSVTKLADTAESAINIASSSLTVSRVAFSEMLSSENPRDHLDDVKTSVRNAVKDIKNAQKSLRETIQELKRLLKSIRVDTPESTATNSSDGNQTTDNSAGSTE